MSSAITKFAKGKPCTARIPNVCNYDPATSVWAHLNSVRWGGGKGKKVLDVCGLIACSNCHDMIDGRNRKSRDGHVVERNFIMDCAFEGHMESLAMLCKAGVIDAT